MLTLPLPPSTNNLFVNLKRGGRVVSADYAAWRINAGQVLKGQPRPDAVPPYAVSIAVNVNHKSDIDNRIKPILDLLVTHKVITGDQWVNTLFIRRDRTVDGCTVHIESDCGVAL